MRRSLILGVILLTLIPLTGTEELRAELKTGGVAPSPPTRSN
ncbi:hypothetical protein ACFQ40_04665 [Kroppenstedtia eburnea]